MTIFRREYAMAQLGKKFTASILGALMLGVSAAGVWAEQGAGPVPERGATVNPTGQPEREISVAGRIVCVDCRLEDVRKQQPETQSLYQLTHQRGRMVMQIDDVGDLRQWQRDTVSDTLHIRAADEIFSQLTDAQAVQKEVTLVGRLSRDHVLDVTAIRIRH
jgi:hypothetical protein